MKWILLLGLFLYTPVLAQDKIITLQGDTVDCRISQHPWKEKIKAGHKWFRGQYSYAYIVAFWQQDSLRLLEPTQLKGFYSHAHTRFLNQGYYESKTYYPRIKTLLQGKIILNEPVHAFFRKIYESTHITVYLTLEEHMAELEWRYFIKKNESDSLLYFSDKKDIAAIFEDTPTLLSSPVLKKFRFRYHRILSLAATYTRIKEEELVGSSY